jgi:hypothetical protein
MLERPLPEELRREIFLALVDAQDQGMTVLQSRKAIAQRCTISESSLVKIEHEGLEKDWPLS